MKKVLVFVSVALLVSSLAFAAGSQEGGQSAPSEPEGEPKGFDQAQMIQPITEQLDIVFIGKVVHPWYDVVASGAQYAVDQFEKLGIEINMIWDSPPEANINAHMRKIEANISRRPDGLAVASLDPATNTQIINEAVAAGLNVITFDTDAPDSDRLLYVGHAGNFQDGNDLGHYLAEQINEQGKVGILTGTLTAPNHVQRVEGFKAAMAEYPNIEVVFERPDNDDLQRALDLTENALQAHPDLVGLFGCNATNPIGAARAVINAGKEDQVHIVGMDDLPETIQFIRQGTIDAVKAQRQWDIGYWSVVYLVALNQNHTIPAEHPTGAQLLTQEFLAQYTSQ